MTKTCNLEREASGCIKLRNASCGAVLKSLNSHLSLDLLYRAILGQLENVVKNIYPEGGTFAGMLGHMPFLLKDN